MNNEQKQYLMNTIVKITNHIETQSDAKRDMSNAYNREIKDSKNRLKLYAKSVAADNIEILEEMMGEFEMAEFMKL
jgi:hypothetical protein